MTITRQWLLNGHPRGRQIANDDLKLVSSELPAPASGQMLLKTLYLGFDPAQKGWMENVADYVAHPPQIRPPGAKPTPTPKP